MVKVAAGEKPNEKLKGKNKEREAAIAERMLQGDWSYAELSEKFGVTKLYLKRLLKKLKEKLLAREKEIPAEKLRIMLDRLNPADDLDLLIDQVLKKIESIKEPEN